MDTSPLKIESDPIPQGWILKEGPNLQVHARYAKVAFRVVTRLGLRCARMSYGIVIQESDLPKWDAAMALTIARRGKVTKYATA